MNALQAGPVSDALVITWRNLKRIPRIPELAIFAILQSIMFVLLFAFVFGGAIPLPDGGDYKEFLMPGIFAQTIAFASATTAASTPTWTSGGFPACKLVTNIRSSIRWRTS